MARKNKEESERRKALIVKIAHQLAAVGETMRYRDFAERTGAGHDTIAAVLKEHSLSHVVGR